jgi:peptidoglycan/xylan/chitin deacetylase (PgdA/CDA1 family)
VQAASASSPRGRATLPPRPIVLTFHDVYRGHLTAALPILAARRWPGVLNLDVSNLAPPWGVGLVGVRKLIAAGWAIDAHSLTHADLALAGGAALTREISSSRHETRRLFGVVPRFFCYPAGRYDAEAVATVEAAGYEGATTTEPGLASRTSPSRSRGSGWLVATARPGRQRSSPEPGFRSARRARRPDGRRPPVLRWAKGYRLASASSLASFVAAIRRNISVPAHRRQL